jgi:hypothetical protein
MAGLFQAVQETGSRDLQYRLVHFVALCYQVAWRCHVDLSGWRSSAAVRAVEARVRMHEYVRQRESTYPLEYDSLSSNVCESSEYLEVSHDAVVDAADQEGEPEVTSAL